MIIDPLQFKESLNSLLERLWVVSVNKTNYRFYTSDNPVVRHTHYDRGFSAYELFYPITPNIGLMILNRKDFLDFLPFNNKVMPFKDKKYVKWYNETQVFLSGRQIFSIENDFRLAKKMIDINPALRDPDRPRIRQLL